MTDRASLGHWVRRFLMEYAASERNLSPNTRESYRDMLVLLLPFAASTKSTSIDKLAVTDLSADTVRAFLAHLENERRCSTATRNQRLASIHALARFIGTHSPQHVEWCAQIRMVPIKKGVANSITYLEKPEIDALLAAPDQSVSQGARDHALLLFLYNSGARPRQRRSGSATSTGMQDRFASSERAARSGVVRSGRIPSRSFAASLANGPMTRPCS